jgi:hypothetical protein
VQNWSRKPLTNGAFLPDVSTRINRPLFPSINADFRGSNDESCHLREGKHDRGQDPENQLIALRDRCTRSGHEIAAEYVEHESRRNSRRDSRRPRREIRARRGRLRLIAEAAQDRWRQSRCQSTVRPFCRSVCGRIRRRNCAFARENAQAYGVSQNQRGDSRAGDVHRVCIQDYVYHRGWAVIRSLAIRLRISMTGIGRTSIDRLPKAGVAFGH